MLGHNTPFKCSQSNNAISAEKQTVYSYTLFLESMYGMRDNWIAYPQTAAELRNVMVRYSAMNVPDADGSIDVVHLKLSKYPAGDDNWSKGRKGIQS